MNNVLVNQHNLVQLSIISELENAGNEESVHSLSLNYTEFKMFNVFNFETIVRSEWKYEQH